MEFKDTTFMKAFFKRLGEESDKIMLNVLIEALDKSIVQDYKDAGFNVTLKPREENV